MAQPLDPLRRADQPAGAADVDLAFLAHRLAAAFGAMVGEDVGRRGSSSGVRFSTTCGMTSPARWISTRSPTRTPSRAISSRIVERALATMTPPTPTGFSRADRRQLAGAADLDVDRLERGLRLLGGEFVGERPARRARDLAEPPLPVEPVDLVDDAVDVERQVGALRLDARDR